MGFLSSITKILKPVTKPVGSAFDSIAGNISDLNNSSLFGTNNSLLRALANPADAVAVGQTLNRSFTDGPRAVVSDNADAGKDGVMFAAAAHRSLFDDTFGELWHGIESGWHSVFDQVKRTWSDVGGKQHWNQLGNSIGHTIDKWGGEQRVVGWVIVGVCVVIYVLVVVFSWGSLSAPATAGLVAVLAAFGSYGLQMGLAPRDEAKLAEASLFYGGDDNSVYTAIDAGSGSGGSQSASGAGGGALSDFANLPPLAIAGAAVVGALGVWYLLAR